MNTAPIQVDNELIRNSCKSLADALRLCLEVSGRSLQEVAWDSGWRDGGKALELVLIDGHIPSERIVPFMVACKNAVPLRYLKMKTRPDSINQTPDGPGQQELEHNTMKAILYEITESLKPGTHEGTTRFSLSGSAGIPDWLIAEIDQQWLRE